MNQSFIEKDIQQTALQCGFENCGIIPLEHLEGFQKHYHERMRKSPSSAVFYKAMEGLTKTRKRFPWAKAMVICTYWYGRYCFPPELQGRYAKAFFLWPEAGCQEGYDLKRFEQWLADHGIRAEGGEQFSHFSVGPLRHAAVMAGLGIIRKNNFFYTEKGSYYNLVGYVIDQECALIHTSNLKPCSNSCTLCQEACRTKALKAPYTMNPLKCVSFLTTFGKGVIPPFLKKEMLEEWICGCDNCQDACPHNRRHDWNNGEDFSDLKELAPQLIPEHLRELSDEQLIRHVISKTADHMKPSDVHVLRKNAKRALNYQKNK